LAASQTSLPMQFQPTIHCDIATMRIPSDRPQRTLLSKSHFARQPITCIFNMTIVMSSDPFCFFRPFFEAILPIVEDWMTRTTHKQNLLRIRMDEIDVRISEIKSSCIGPSQKERIVGELERLRKGFEEEIARLEGNRTRQQKFREKQKSLLSNSCTSTAYSRRSASSQRKRQRP
jgi:hypothetical protein